MTAIHPALAGGPIYLDYHATTPVDPAVVEAVQPYLLHHFGNPSSSYPYGASARRALEQARAQVATLLGVDADGIVFCGSGSEANNLALRGTVLASGIERPHVITQVTEHPAVLATCRALQRWHGVRVTYLPADGDGLVDPAALADAITPDTVLVSVMAANNETGVLQPLTELTRIAHAHGIPVHTDAAQAAGKIPFNVAEIGVDLCTVVGHKMYAPKGIAALHVRPGLAVEPLIYGGGQEHGHRAGTENVAYAVGLGAAAQRCTDELAAGEPQRLGALRDRLHRHLADGLPTPVIVNGHPEQRLPHTLNISTTGLRGDDLLAATPQVAASTGSACHAGTTEPSPVLSAMGYDPARALAAVRLSLGRWSTVDEIDRAADLVTTAARTVLTRNGVETNDGAR
ncbi:cysteine desulfurase family protein [Actinoplanes sp. NPDC051346]|uniref:cysteine desulfurase family protein n=1 Tax=Actinoplanes sp. NPDC051346 TaxID=3155048 RepID=UPI003414CFC4